VSRTGKLLVTSPILYQLDHCTHQCDKRADRQTDISCDGTIVRAYAEHPAVKNVGPGKYFGGVHAGGPYVERRLVIHYRSKSDRETRGLQNRIWRVVVNVRNEVAEQLRYNHAVLHRAGHSQRYSKTDT